MKPVFAVVVLAPLASAHADVFAHFDIWVEAPSVVQSGDVIDVAVWAQASGPATHIGSNALGAFAMDLPIAASGQLVSSVDQPVFGSPTFFSWVLTVDPTGLYDVGAFQLGYPGSWVSYDNPILLFTTRLHTIDGVVGEIELLPQHHDSVPAMISWWIDLNDFNMPSVTDADPDAD
ncbi:MAG: hypothetical protein Kow0022_12390 [Phycisphaerales bacterium]